MENHNIKSNEDIMQYTKKELYEFLKQKLRILLKIGFTENL